jgi:4-amino-4-deoxy-L-arabinose transferase-like glycosyltransferase
MHSLSRFHLLAWSLLLALLACLFLPRTFIQGMFFDGMVYATLARNLAVDLGSFWAPVYLGPTSPFDPGTPFFAEHPPLFFGLESLLFRLLGNGFYVEKICCLLFLSLTIALLAWLWRLSLRPLGASLPGYAWWPVLCWYLSPVVMWAYPNNLLELGMTAFDLLAVGLGLLAWQAHRRFAWLWAALAGLAVGLAFLTKGPVGLYPLVFCLLWAWGQGQNRAIEWKKAGLLTAITLGSLILMVTLLSLHAPAVDFMAFYLQEQVGRALVGTRESTVLAVPLGRFALLPMLATELAPVLLLLLLLRLGLRLWGRSPKPLPGLNRQALAWLLLALSASLPIMLSTKQRHFYLLPSLPLYALAAATYSLSWLRALHFSWSRRSFVWGMGLALLLGLVGLGFAVQQFGKPARDQDKLQAIEAFSPYLAPGQRLFTCPAAMQDMGTAAYFDRYLRVYLEAAAPGQPLSLIDEKHCAPVPDSTLLARTPRFGLWLPPK